MNTSKQYSAASVALVRALTLIALCSVGGCATTREGPVAGQEVAFFPSPVSLAASGEWSLTIQGRVFEPAEHSGGRQALITWAANTLAPAMAASPADAEQSARFRERAGYLLADSAGNTRVTVKVGQQLIPLPASNSAGYFTADIPLSDQQVSRLARAGRISFTTVPGSPGAPTFTGAAVVVPAEGLLVVSDVDDTIKVTDIVDRKQALKNTLLEPFAPVPGMPALYRSWQAALGPRIHFHIVSAGPWQLNAPLQRFVEEEGFPPFTWTMRSVDISNPAAVVATLTSDPRGFKRQAIQALMTRFPRRHVLLVGDSGEHDPEVYADIVAEFGDRVDAVFIRNVTEQDCGSERYQRYQDFVADLRTTKLSVFRDPGELPPLTPESPGQALCPPRR